MARPRFETPIAFFIFNRPKTTQAVFEQIAEQRPTTLLVVADGPRISHPQDVAACAEARAVLHRVDWDCNLLTNFADRNVGCRGRMASGIDWVFEHVDEAIILEDDCLPASSFFPYCAELLLRYRTDERIMMISGDNFTPRAGDPYSYHFSRQTNTWGWATWRRAWAHFDLDLQAWPELRKSGWMDGLFSDEEIREHWRKVFDITYAGNNAWDYQWAFACWTQNGLSVTPTQNLVSNIGFGQGATHTHVPDGKTNNLHVGEATFPMRHPPFCYADMQAEAAMRDIILPHNSSLKERAMHRYLRIKHSLALRNV